MTLPLSKLGPRPLPRRACLLVNGKAARAPGAWEAEVHAILAQRFAVTAVHPGSAAEMVAAVRAHRGDPDTLLVIAGGDGSFNMALAAEAEGPLAILPLGTANDLSRALTLPLQPAAAARRLLTARPRTWDCISVNGRRFATVGGLGTAADVAVGAQRLRAQGQLGLRAARLLGPRFYHAAAAAIIAARPLSPAAIELTLTPPGGRPAVRHRYQSAAVLVANTQRLAGALHVSPRSRPDDGVFEICVLRASTRAALLATLVRLLRGTTTGADLVVHSAVGAKLQLDRPAAFFGDGEVLAQSDRLELGIVPGALTLLG
jgi:diacylglycerol kinase (ATP)